MHAFNVFTFPSMDNSEKTKMNKVSMTLFNDTVEKRRVCIADLLILLLLRMHTVGIPF